MPLLIVLFVLAFIVFVIYIGVASVEYDIFAIFHQHIPFIAALIIAFFLSEISVPLAVLIWILRACGVLHS